MICDGQGKKEKSRTVLIENKAMATRFKEDSEEKEAEAVTEETIRVTGMKEVEYTIDCPAIPITHAVVEFQNTKIRDRNVRSANKQQTQLNGQAKKNITSFRCRGEFSPEKTGVHQMCASPKTRDSSTPNTTATRKDNRCCRYHNIEDEVKELMTKWLTKNSSQRL